MKKTFTFKKSNNNTFLFPEYTTTFKSPKKNYSEILDDIIAADVIEDNKYLFKNYNIGTDPIYISSSLKGDDDFIKATKFLANYKKNKSIYNLPIIFGKMYHLIDGTPIVFYDDELQIGFDVYKYSDFNDYSFLSTISKPKKTLIIDIFTKGIDNIKINIL
jgi:hypothetical protein